LKVALFYPHNYLASHYALFSYRETLERMGHQVLDCPLPGNQIHDLENVKKRMPPTDVLNQCDVILAGFFEYVQPWLAQVYGFENWSKLKVPVIARFDESMDRTDLQLPVRIEELKRWATHYSFPAAQDAEKYGGDWLPFGADTTIFRSARVSKLYDVGFVGSLYPTRKKYINELAPHLGRDINVRIGNALVQDLSGICERESTELLAHNYRQCRIFLCLPPLSRLIVEKVFDVISCGTFCMFPKLLGDAEKNMSLFADGHEIVYYDVGFFIENAKQIKYYLDHDAERERIASNGSKKVHELYGLDQMLEKLLAMAK
jgi:hypothetical protein